MPERTLFWRWFGLGPTGPGGSANTIFAVRNGSLKLVVEAATSSSPPELFNYMTDVGETQNLASIQPTDVAALTQSYNTWNLGMVAPFFQMNSPFLSGLPDSISLAGDWNNFGITETKPPWGLSWISAPGSNGTPDGLNWYTGIIHAARSGGDTLPGVHNFALVGGKSYANQWGGGTIAIDAISLPAYFTGTSLGPLSSITFADNSYYSFRILDPNAQPATALKLAVMKTSAPPVTLTRSSQTPAAPLAGDPVTIGITTTETKSPEERIFVRWTNDSYLTSHLIETSGFGTAYAATIPGQPANTSVQYTAISSTVDLSPLTDAGTIDPLVLATTDSYHFVTPPATPTPTPTPTATPSPTPNGFPQITQQPANATVKIGRVARFQVVATGTLPLRYQWRKNGSNISGATKATYKTPPVTSDDNGALFDVVVTNKVGSVTSNQAILTLR